MHTAGDIATGAFALRDPIVVPTTGSLTISMIHYNQRAHLQSLRFDIQGTNDVQMTFTTKLTTGSSTMEDVVKVCFLGVQKDAIFYCERAIDFMSDKFPFSSQWKRTLIPVSRRFGIQSCTHIVAFSC